MFYRLSKFHLFLTYFFIVLLCLIPYEAECGVKGKEPSNNEESNFKLPVTSIQLSLDGSKLAAITEEVGDTTWLGNSPRSHLYIWNIFNGDLLNKTNIFDVYMDRLGINIPMEKKMAIKKLDYKNGLAEEPYYKDQNAYAQSVNAYIPRKATITPDFKHLVVSASRHDAKEIHPALHIWNYPLAERSMPHEAGTVLNSLVKHYYGTFFHTYSLDRKLLFVCENGIISLNTREFVLAPIDLKDFALGTDKRVNISAVSAVNSKIIALGNQYTPRGVTDESLLWPNAKIDKLSSTLKDLAPKIQVWNLNSKNPKIGVVKLQKKINKKITGITALAFNSNGTKLASGTRAYDAKKKKPKGKTLIIWNIANDQNKIKMKSYLELNYTNPVLSLAFSPDGSILACGAAKKGEKEGELTLWDVKEGTLLKTFEHDYTVRTVVFTSDGKSVIGGGGNRDAGEVEIWDIETGTEIVKFQ